MDSYGRSGARAQQRTFADLGAVIIAITGASTGGAYLIAFLVGMVAMLVADPPDWLRRRWLEATGRNSRR